MAARIINAVLYDTNSLGQGAPRKTHTCRLPNLVSETRLIAGGLLESML
jgi:hypothetical protein